jgi:peptidyl-prolyl cis-trans isomerase SurA
MTRITWTVVMIAALAIGGAPAHARTTPRPAARPATRPTAAAEPAESTLVAPEVVNRIVATIDGEPVTLFELRAFADQMRQRAATAGGAAGGGGGGADGQVPADDRAVLDELVLDKILHKQIQEQGVAATDQQIDAYIASIKERNKLDDASLRQALAQQGLSWEQYRAQVRTDIERAALINKEIRNKVNVSPEEVERYYKEHLTDYGTPAKAHVRLISLLVPSDATPEQKVAIRAQGEGLRKEAASGKDFAKLAKEHSQGPGADDGGDIGEVARGQMQSEFENAVFALKPGEVSEVIETASGYHIFKLEQRSGEAHQPLAEVADDIREKLYRETMEARYDRWLKEDLRAKYHVEILL